jgi:hypothetical protein
LIHINAAEKVDFPLISVCTNTTFNPIARPIETAVKVILLIVLPVVALALAVKEANAVCYCACITATGGRCTVSVPNYSCHREGKSLCVDPLERCTYRCDVKLERPAMCNPRRRCSIRGTG